MTPIYFPFTYISDHMASAYHSCFGKLIVYQPTNQNIPQNMKELEKKHLIDIKFPIQEDDDKILTICKEYKGFGDLYQKDGIKSLKAHNNGIPFFGDSSTHKIRDDVQGYLKEETGKKPSPDIKSRIFLNIAQEFDQTHDEMGKGLQTIENKERRFLDMLKGEEIDTLDEKTGGKTQVQEDIGGYLTKDRMVSWTHLKNHDKENSGLFITSSPSIWDFLLDLSPLAEIVFHSHDIPFNEKSVSDETRNLMEYMEALLKNPWPQPDLLKPKKMACHGEKLAFKLFIVPGTGPDQFFTNFLSESGSKVKNDTHSIKYKNTLIALAVL